MSDLRNALSIEFTPSDITVAPDYSWVNIIQENINRNTELLLLSDNIKECYLIYETHSDCTEVYGEIAL